MLGLIVAFIISRNFKLSNSGVQRNLNITQSDKNIVKWLCNCCNEK